MAYYSLKICVWALDWYSDRIAHKVKAEKRILINDYERYGGSPLITLKDILAWRKQMMQQHRYDLANRLTAVALKKLRTL